MKVVAAHKCGECGDTVFVRVEHAVAIVDDGKPLTCATHS